MVLGALLGSFFGNKVSIGYYEVEGASSVDAGGALSLGLQVFSVLRFDASIEEEHKVSVDITDHPVEDGAAMSDHRVKRPIEFTLTAIVTNTPPALGAIFRYANVATRDVDTWEILNTIAQNKALLTVVTTLKTYENMVIKEMSAPRTAALGNSLEVTITFREAFVAESEEVVAPLEKENTPKAKKSAGNGVGKVAAGKKRTLFKLAMDAIGG